jgi:POT family proton-dependent oligopeptide transporter
MATDPTEGAVTASTAGHIPPDQQPHFFGHPAGLYVLFATEMWERFSYYGMRGLLRAYMVYFLFSTAALGTYPQDPTPPAEAPTDPNTVFGWSAIRGLYSGDASVNDFASHIYGLYTALVYLTPFFGGLLADRWLGQRRTVVIGGAFMALGHFVMASHQFFFVALGLLIIGNGAFKPNISTQVGDLYAPGDPRRDGAFTVFYMGINLGAFLSNLVCGTLAATIGWHYGFGAAGVGMVLGLIVYLFGRKYLAPEKPRIEVRAAAAASAGGGSLTKAEWARVGALVFLCLLNVSFWAVYEQQGNTMQAWADEQTVWPVIAGFQIPQNWFQSFNPFMIFALAPLLDMFWRWQAGRGTEPSSVAKMAIGSIVLGLSFLVMVVGATLVGDGKGSLFWPFFCTLILTVGELYLSPIGLSLVTKVAPARIVSMMMGMWFISSFFGNYLSGVIGTLYDDMSKQSFFMMLCAIGVVTGLAMWALNRPLKRALGTV